jgi:hypothetical protein
MFAALDRIRGRERGPTFAKSDRNPRPCICLNGHFGVVDLDRTETVAIDDRLRSPHPDQRGSTRVDERTVLTASRHGTVFRIDVESGLNTCVARLDMLALGCDMTAGPPGIAYILEHRGSPRAFIPIVVRLSGSLS